MHTFYEKLFFMTETRIFFCSYYADSPIVAEFRHSTTISHFLQLKYNYEIVVTIDIDEYI